MHAAEPIGKVIERADELALRIRYETHRPPAAAAVGQMLQDVTRSFEDYANGQARFAGATLAVHRLEEGSFFADLNAVGQALQTLYDHKELLAGFVTHVQGVVQMLLGLPGHVKEVDRRAVESLAAPVAGQPNVNITINVQGSHNTVRIDAELIDRLTARRVEPA